MPEGVSELSREAYDIHMLMFWICFAIAVVTFGAMIVAMIRFRKSRGAVADQKLLHNARLEATWTIIPVLILIGMAIPSVDKLIRIEDTSGSGLTVKVTGHQWYWQYEYLGSGVSFYSRLARESDVARQTRIRHRSGDGRTLPARRRQAARRSDRRQDPHAPDRQ